MGAKSGTSFREQVIFYYIRKFYPDAVNRYKYDGIGELDIYIPSEKIAVEYDGSYWHKNKLSIDNRKNTCAKNEGIRLIRIREYGLGNTVDAYGEIHLPPREAYVYGTKYLDIVVKTLGDYIENEAMVNFQINEDEYKRSLPDIYSRIYNKKVVPNLTEMCGIELWAKDMNGELDPECIPKDEWAYALLRCKNNKLIELPQYHREYKEQCQKYEDVGCEQCFSHIICPLMKWCQGKGDEITKCEVIERQVHKMINRGIYYGKFKYHTALHEWLWKKSDLGIEIVKEFLALSKSDPKRKKYLRFFGFRLKENGDGISSTSLYVKNQEEIYIIQQFAKELPYTVLDVSLYEKPIIEVIQRHRDGSSDN